ncbi:MAG: phosphatase PAP2 family protein [Nocardioides sp.]
MSRGIRDLVLLALLYVGSSASRLVADDAFTPAAARALQLLDLERVVWLDVEALLNGWFVSVPLLGLVGSYWYASLHYIVTAAVLVWLYRRGPADYLPARTALAVATILALGLYLMVPMAPPRLLDGYVDVLQLNASSGWWGGDASAPRGLGGLTNQLAAFPSLHAGWALWVALVVRRHVRSRWVRGLAWAYVAGTTVAIVGTGNHWLLDAVAGWFVVAVAWEIVNETGSRPRDERSATTPAGASRKGTSFVDGG